MKSRNIYFKFLLYFFIVIFFSSCMHNNSEEKVENIRGSIPDAPTNLKAPLRGMNSITLNWLDSSQNETGFKIFMNGDLIEVAPEDSTSFTVLGLNEDTTYTFTVQAANDVGDSTAITITAATQVNNQDETITFVGVSDSAIIELSPTLEKSLHIDSSDVAKETNSSVIEVYNPVSEIQKFINTPLFIDGKFRGMIASAEAKRGTTKIVTKNARNVTDVYSNFNVEFNLDRISQSINRTLSQKKIGRYDHINKTPLKAIVYKKMISTKGRKSQEELVLRVHIPKGYQMPIEPRAIDCDFWDANCSATVGGEAKKNIDLGKELEKYGLTFSTNDSYIEFGLGTYVKAYYDANMWSKDVFEFELRNNAYFESNLVFTINGELEKSWESKLPILKGINLKIPHPFSYIATVSSVIKPEIIVGASGKITSEFKATSYNKREGEMRFQYSSTDGRMRTFKTIKYETKPLTLNFEIEAEANAFVYPNISIAPGLTFLSIDKPLTFGSIRNGIKLDNTLRGKFTSSFTLENNEANSELGAEASFKSVIFPFIEYKFNVKVGEKLFYENEEAVTLYQGKEAVIYDWKMALLPVPIIDIKNSDSNDKEKLISFDIKMENEEGEEDADTKKHVKYYYTLDGSQIPISSLNSAIPWDKNSIKISKTTTLIVRAVLKNSDVEQNATWAQGTSYSKQFEQVIEPDKSVPPIASPVSGTKFENGKSINVALQHKYNDFKIYYTLDGTEPNIKSKVYQGTIMLKDSTTIKAVAVSPGGILSGVSVFSYSEKSNNNPLFLALSCPNDNNTYAENIDTLNAQGIYCHYTGFIETDYKENHHRFEFYDVNKTKTIVYYNTSGQKHGNEKSYYENRQLKHEVTYVNGLEHGIYHHYYENGQLSQEVPFTNGKADGIVKSYDENGQLIKMKLFKNDKMQSMYKYSYFSNKKLSSLASYDGDFSLHGEQKTYFSTGRAASISTYKNSKEHGYFKEYYENGQLKLDAYYENDLLEGALKEYYSDGQIMLKKHYLNGSLHGLHQEYHENGVLTLERSYINGKKAGKEKVYLLSGFLESEIVYENGEIVEILKYVYYQKSGALKEFYRYGDSSKKNWAVKTYYKSGQLKSSETYVNYKLNGSTIRYYDNGRVSSEVVYKNGKKDGIEIEYYESGFVSSRTKYKDGIEIHEIGYYENGNPWLDVFSQDDGSSIIKIFNKQDGTLNSCSYNTDSGTSIDHYCDGIYYQYYSNGNLKWKESYRNTKKDGMHYRYSQDGSLFFEMYFIDGLLHGVLKTYRNNNVDRCFYYDHGQVQKPCDASIYVVKEYYKNGALKSETPYVNGEINGELTIYSESSIALASASFVDGKQHGYEKLYDDNGNILGGCSYYENGKYIKYVQSCSNKILSVKYWLWKTKSETDMLSMKFNQPISPNNLQIISTSGEEVDAIGINEKDLSFNYFTTLRDENFTILGEDTYGDKFSLTQRFRDTNLSMPVSSDFIKDENEKIVIDTSTGFMWQDNQTLALNFQEAKEYCENLKIGDYNNWKVPGKQELKSITRYDKNDFNINDVFNHIYDSWYWTDTKDNESFEKNWVVNPIQSTLDLQTIYKNNYVKCIRQEN